MRKFPLTDTVDGVRRVDSPRVKRTGYSQLRPSRLVIFPRKARLNLLLHDVEDVVLISQLRGVRLNSRQVNGGDEDGQCELQGICRQNRHGTSFIWFMLGTSSIEKRCTAISTQPAGKRLFKHPDWSLLSLRKHPPRSPSTRAISRRPTCTEIGR